VGPIWNDGRRFSGRVALVTGAGGTLGGAVATGFGRESASVVVGYRRSPKEAESVAADIASAGGAACTAELDVTDQASVERFVAQADATYGRIDVLVNTAGRIDGADTVRFEDMTDAATALLMVDVIGAMRMCHAVIPAMRRGGHGVIINFSSTYGQRRHPWKPDQLGAGHILRSERRDSRVHRPIALICGAPCRRNHVGRRRP
jgi:NAD(P)-dependent dehydrogenase (short-subunit alcohol dehydrogenase family)